MSIKSVVGIFAHPDDETVMAGGIVRLLTQQGVKVHLVSATRGEGGETGAPIISLARTDLGHVRERELRCAAQALGATVSLLNYTDPVIGPDDTLRAFEADFATLARQIANIASRHEADVILTHGSDGEYGHPAHVLVHRAVVEGITRLYPRAMIYTVAANVASIEDRLWNSSQPAHLALDIRPWAEAKIAAMECHQTQHALFMRRRKLSNVREALRTVESLRKIHPDPHDTPPSDAFATLLRTAGAWQPQT